MSSIFQRVSSRWVTGSSDKGVDSGSDDENNNDNNKIEESSAPAAGKAELDEAKSVGDGSTETQTGAAEESSEPLNADAVAATTSDSTARPELAAKSVSETAVDEPSKKRSHKSTEYIAAPREGDAMDVAIDPEIRSDYRSDGNVDAEVLKLVGASLEQDNKRRRADGDIGDWSHPQEQEHEWQSYLKPESLRDSNAGPGPGPSASAAGHVPYMFDGGKASSGSGTGRRKRVSHASNSSSGGGSNTTNIGGGSSAGSNVDPALEHLDDSHQNFDLVQEAVRQARSIRAEVDGSEALVTVPSVSDTFDDHESLEHLHGFRRDPVRRGPVSATGSSAVGSSAAANLPSSSSAASGAANLPSSSAANIPPSSSSAAARSSSPSRRSAWTGDGSEHGGPFTTDESDQLNKFLESYRKQRGWTKDQLKQRVWTNERQRDNFWDDIAAAMPQRTRASIYKHIRRSYHVFEVRGRWTPEEDALLAELVQRKGAQWKAIGLDMDRMPEDCRDRWRNYVKCGDNRKSSKWDLKEEITLRDVVVQMQRTTPEVPINWTLISEQMGGTRSRIQCRYKWNKLLKKIEHIGSEMDFLRLSERMVLVEKLRSYRFDSERQVEWEQVATALQEEAENSNMALDGISAAALFTPRQCQLAYRNLSYMIEEHESKSIQQVLAEVADVLYRSFMALRESN